MKKNKQRVKLLPKVNPIAIKFILLAYLAIGLNIGTYAQNIGTKELLGPETTAYFTKVDYSRAKINDDGHFVYYSTSQRNRTTGKFSRKAFLQSTSSTWKRQVSPYSGLDFLFLKDKAIYKTADTLKIITLGTNNELSIPSIANFSIAGDNANEILVLETISKKGQLLLMNLNTKKQHILENVLFYTVCRNEVIYTRKTKNNIELVTYQLKTARERSVWQGQISGKHIVSLDKRHLAFVSGSNEQNPANVVMLYDIDRSKISTFRPSFPELLPINPNGKIKILSFTKDNKYLNLEIDLEKSLPKTEKKKEMNIWAYFDPKLPVERDNGPGLVEVDSYRYSLDIQHGICTFLNNNKEEIISRLDNIGDYVLVETKVGGYSAEYFFNRYSIPTTSIVSRKTGKRQLYNLEKTLTKPQLSPCGRFMVYYSPKQRNYYCYDLHAQKVTQISNNINTDWTVLNDTERDRSNPMGIAGWSREGDHIYIYDRNDIYLFDLSGKEKPKNITNGLGKRNGIFFSLGVLNGKEIAYDVPSKNKFFLTAFNRDNKQDGFYLFDPQAVGKDPIPVSMHDKLVSGIKEQDNSREFYPVKAASANAYLLRMESAEESPNLYYTQDFKNFKALTNIHPEKAYNWLNNELITWKTFDGSTSQGMLYKPENFDPSKKYPLIFLYYEKFSNGLHNFEPIDALGAEIDLRYYTSNGYLIFVPDIHYTYGNPGASAYNSVVSAAEHLKTFPWIDDHKMALNGHSFGGYQTSYIIAHTNLFAAACANAGWTNFISSANRITLTGGPTTYYENYRQRMGANMWERPDLYIQSSPIFRVHKVVTPLLMTNNYADKDVIFLEGAQFFIGLRRLGKKAWMLNYETEGHTILDRSNQQDFNLRMKQFFDFYLKDAPAPKWMLESLSEKEDGIEEGLKLDTQGRRPGLGILTDEQQKRADSLIKRKPITFKLY